MATTTSNLGLTIWNSDNDFFDYSVLARNFQIIDGKFPTGASDTPVRYIENSATVPVGVQTDGRMIYLTADNSGFTANTLIQYRNGQWYEMGQPELVTTTPSTNNFVGRMIVFKQAYSSFAAGDVAVCTNAGIPTYTKVSSTGVGNAAKPADIVGAVSGNLYVITGTGDTSYPAYSLAYCTSTTPSNTFQSIVGVPPGAVFPFVGTTAPNGWLLCDYSAISRNTYSTLFAIIGTKYGIGDGSTTFNLPDLRGRVPVGLGTHSDVNDLGKSDGISSANVGYRRPKHRHTPHGHTATTTARDVDGTFSAGGGGVAVASSLPVGTVSIATADGGSGNTNDSLDAPAYQVFNYIIKF